MLKNIKYRKIINIFLDIVIILMTAISVIYTYFYGTTGNMEGSGALIFRYFTILSNIFLIIMVIFDLIHVLLKNNSKNMYIDLLRHSGVMMITITFLVVVAFLGPLAGYIPMAEGTNLIFHFLSPIFAILLSILCFDKYTFNFKKSLLALIPLLTYSIIYFLMVIIFKIWPDFYAFNMNNMWVITVFIFIILGFGLDILYITINKLTNK